MEEYTPLAPSIKYDAIKINGPEDTAEADVVAAEVPFTIHVNDTEVATLMCTPSNLRELCYGFLYTNGVIKNKNDVVSCDVNLTDWTGRVRLDNDADLTLYDKRLHAAGRGKELGFGTVVKRAARNPLKSKLKIDRSLLGELMDWVLKSSDLFKTTGGVHSTALSHRGEVPAVAMDDIGRYNSVDKAVGEALLRGVDFSQHLVLCSGRTSSDMILKIKRCGVAVSVSPGAPTHLAIILARASGVTLIGFTRGARCNVYSHPSRIKGLK